MCNAWNHPINCTCGWGGQGHAGRRVYDEAARLAPYLGSCFREPNALCPVCDEPIYYVEPRSGGRVFFDELGPPWPKHPCTDIASHDFSRPAIAPKESKIPAWKKDGWVPLEIKEVEKQKAATSLKGTLEGKSLEVYVYTKYDPIDMNCPVLVKPLDGETYKVSCVHSNGQIGFGLAYTSQLLCEYHESKWVADEKKLVWSGPEASVPNQDSSSKSKVSYKSPSGALAIAFKHALNKN